MFAKESKRVRHFVGRCERGEDVHAALLSLAVEHGIQAGWVRGLGAFEAVELQEYDQAAHAYRPAVRFESALEVLSLTGSLSSQNDQPFAYLHVTLSRETDNGVQVLGGHLQRGRVFALEFYVEAFDDVALVRERDAATGLQLFAASARAGMSAQAAPTRDTDRVTHGSRQHGSPEDSHVATRPASPAASEPVIERARERAWPRPEAAAEPVAQAVPRASGVSGVTWAMAATASEEAQHAPVPSRGARPSRPQAPSVEPKAPAHRPPPLRGAAPAPHATDALFDEPIPEVGEYLDHKQFGLCKIERMDDDGGVMLRMPDRGKKLIKLDVLQVLEPRIEGDRVIYPVRPRGQRKA